MTTTFLWGFGLRPNPTHASKAHPSVPHQIPLQRHHPRNAKKVILSQRVRYSKSVLQQCLKSEQAKVLARRVADWRRLGSGPLPFTTKTQARRGDRLWAVLANVRLRQVRPLACERAYLFWRNFARSLLN